MVRDTTTGGSGGGGGGGPRDANTTLQRAIQVCLKQTKKEKNYK